MAAKERTRKAPPGAPGEPPTANVVSQAERLDLADPAAVRRWLADLRVAVDDSAAVAEDMLRPPRRRDLGPREHRRLYQDAAAKLDALFDHADPPQDSSGSGSA